MQAPEQSGETTVMNAHKGKLKVTTMTGLLVTVVLAAFFILNDWIVVLICLPALALALSPFLFAKRLGVQLPLPFLALITLFAFASIFMGEVWNFYERI